MWVSHCWTVAAIAEAFHVLPSVAARDLETDPLQLSIACLKLLRYRDCKADYDRRRRQKKDAGTAVQEWRSNWGELAAKVEAYEFKAAEEAMAMQGA